MDSWRGICAIDTETTGLQAYKHDLIEIAIIPLNNDFTVNAEIPPFCASVRPEHPDTITDGALEINKHTREEILAYPERIETVRAFVSWFEEHVVKAGLKSIVPVGHNFSFDRNFIAAWLDPESKQDNAYGAFFHYHYHDSMHAAMFLNTRVQMKAPGTKVPFWSVSLQRVCKALNFSPENAHSAYGDALASAEVYRRLCML